MNQDKDYLLDNQQSEAGQRFDALSVLFNPTTFRHVRALRLARGWRVWEVGAGSPSVPAHLAAQVGREGHVLATDIDTSWLDSPDAVYEVRRHDVASEPPPPGLFDLVHARLVLVHVARRAQALASMVAAVRPGGWLLREAGLRDVQADEYFPMGGPACSELERATAAWGRKAIAE